VRRWNNICQPASGNLQTIILSRPTTRASSEIASVETFTWQSDYTNRRVLPVHAMDRRSTRFRRGQWSTCWPSSRPWRQRKAWPRSVRLSDRMTPTREQLYTTGWHIACTKWSFLPTLISVSVALGQTLMYTSLRDHWH